MTEKNGFRTVGSSGLEEIEEKLHKRRMRTMRRVLIAAAVCLVLIAALLIWMEVRQYTDYETTGTLERASGESTAVVSFCGCIAEYSADGISCRDGNGKLMWNQSFQMNEPAVDICEGYLAVYDRSATDIYLFSESGPFCHIETVRPILTVCAAAQGTTAVLMEDDGVYYVKLYDKSGAELTDGRFYAEEGCYPVDIALSSDAQKLVVDLVDISGGGISSVLTFYNFGSVGQNEVDNNVGTFSYEGLFIPEIRYVTGDCLAAVGDDRILIFEGSQKPSLAQEIPLEQEVLSVCFHKKYIGILTQNMDGEMPYHITVYDMKGSVRMEADTDVDYDSFYFLDNNCLCVAGRQECDVFNMHGIRKFHCLFDKDLCFVVSVDRYRDYRLVFKDAVEEVRLK